MRPQLAMSRLDPKDPRMLRWVYFVAHHGDGGSKVTYESVFFHWLRNQLLMIEDYSYEGAKFCEDPELPLPQEVEWDERGKKYAINCVFNF